MRGPTTPGWLLIALLAGGCDAPAGDAPSLLDLRAALLSTPAVIEALPLEHRMRLATQMEAAGREQRAWRLVAATEASLATDLLEVFDEPRSLEGEEAIVVIALDHRPEVASLHTLGGESPDGGAPTDAPDVPLVLVDPELLEDPAARALSGRAGEILQRMARETGAREVLLSDPMPAGLLGDRDRLHVNPVWLLLLASIEEHDEVGRASAELIEPLGHHDTDSTGWGCYGNVCETTPRSCGPPSCECGTYGLDCGPCACECGRDSEGIHCSTAPRERAPGSPLDWIWLLAPVAFLLLQRRTG